MGKPGRLSARFGVCLQVLRFLSHLGGVTEDVRGVGVPGCQPERAFAAAAEEDRQRVLQWAWVAGRLRYVENLAAPGVVARAPEHREQLERVLEQGVAVADR